MGTDDDHVDDEHPHIINDDTNLQNRPAYATESITNNTGIGGGLGSTTESQNHFDGGFGQQSTQ